MQQINKLKISNQNISKKSKILKELKNSLKILEYGISENIKINIPIKIKK